MARSAETRQQQTRQARQAWWATRAVPTSVTGRLIAFALLLLAAVGTLAGAFQVPYRATVEVGEPAQERRVSGFHAAEGAGEFTYRWTTDRAAVRLPLGVFPGEAVVVLSGDRPGNDPPAATLAVEDAPPVPVQTDRTFAVYPVSLPATGAFTHPFALPTLTIAPANVATPPRDNRALGVAVQRVIVYTNPLRFGPVVPPLLALLLVFGMAATLAALVLSLAPSWGYLVAAAYGPVAFASAYLALRRADDPGEQARAVAGFAVATVAALLLSRRQDVAATAWAQRVSRLDGRLLVGGAVMIAGGYAAYASNMVYGQLYDDTYITLRYARNFADGFGVVYNPGLPPVEGYTNFSLTILLAGAAKLGLPLPETVRTLSVLAAVALVAATYRLASRVLPEAPGIVRAVPSLVLAVCGWFAYFAAIGLETHLFALAVVLAACLTLERRYAAASLLFAFAYLTRPEGVGLWAVSAVWLVGHLTPRPPLHLWRGGESPRDRSVPGKPQPSPQFSPPPPVERGAGGEVPRRDLARFALPFALVAGAHELFRLAYYGVPVPNTFYAKVGTGAAQLRRGAAYVLDTLPAPPPVIFALLVAAATLLPGRVVMRPAARYLALLAAAFTAYVALVGGDFIGPRFLMHLLPVYVILALAGLVALFGVFDDRRKATAYRAVPAQHFPAPFAAGFVALWLFLPLVPPGTFAPQGAHARIVTGLTVLGRYLRENAPPGSSLAIEVAGVVPYESGLTTIDMLGLNDAHIARTAVATGAERAGHEKQDPRYVLAQRPAYIAVGLTPRGRPGRGLDLPGFDAQYRLVALTRMDATAAAPDLVLPVAPGINAEDVEAAMRRGYTYALYQRREG